MIAISPCPDATLIWPALVGESLTSGVQEHLRGCLSCRRRIQQLSAELSQIQRLCNDPEFHHSSEGVLSNSFETTSAVEPLARGAFPDIGGLIAKRRSGTARHTGAIPERIGRYVVRDLLGSGAQGTVYRGTHPNLGHSIVLKWAHDRIAASPEGTDQLIHEGRILAAIQHPALVRVIDLDVHQDRPFLVFEDCDGLPLTTYIQHQNLTLDDIVQIVGEVARGLEVVHEAGVLHLDLKPENILIQANGRPKLIDFGIAWVSRSLRRDGDEHRFVAGTPEYMAPEQAAGDRSQWDQRTDLYGLGGVLRFLLNATAPPEVEPIDPDGDADQPCLELISLPAAPAETSPRTGVCRRSTSRVDTTTFSSNARRDRLRELSEWATQEAPANRPGSASEFAMALARIDRHSHRSWRSWLVLIACLTLPTMLLAAAHWRTIANQSGELRVITSTEIDLASEMSTGETVWNHCARIEAEIPHGTSGGLYLLSPSGRVASLGSVPAQTVQHRRIRFPASQQQLSLGQNGAKQVFVMGIVRQGPPPTAEQLQSSLAGCIWEVPDEFSLVKFDEQGLLKQSSSGGTVWGDNPDSTVQSGIASLRQLLSEQFDEFTAVIINHPLEESRAW